MKSTLVKGIRASLLSIVALLVVVSLPVNASSDYNVVVVHSDQWMPFNGTPESGEEGYAIDVLREIFREYGIKVLYEERPWKRSVADLEDGLADMVVGAFKFEMPDFIFPETTIGVSRMGFYSSLPHWEFVDFADLRRVKIGIVSGWGYRKWLLEDYAKHPDNYEALSGDDAFPRLMKMLVERRIQAIPSTSAVMDYYIKSHGLTGKVFFGGFGPNPQPMELYFALSPAKPKRSKELAGIIDKGIRKLRDSGKLEEILNRYGLHDWE